MSIATACSWSIGSIIVFRALQGLFGGVLIPTVLKLIYAMFPKRLQPTLTIIVGSVVTIAPTTGPILGVFNRPILLALSFSYQCYSGYLGGFEYVVLCRFR